MGRTSWIGAGVALVAGFGAGVLAGPELLPPAPANPNMVDLSVLSEELRDKHRDEAYLRAEEKTYEMGKEMVAKQAAERAKRPRVALPEGMESVPLGVLYKPGADVRWPEGVGGELGEALEAAKDGWVILNYWASWCAPCVHELPEMGEAMPVFASKGVTLIAVDTDPMKQDTAESARKLFADKGVGNLVPYVAEGAVLDALLEATGQSTSNLFLPTNVIFAPGGVPYAVFEGGNMKEDKVWTASDTLRFLDLTVAGT